MLLVVNIGNTNIRFGVFKTNENIISWTFNSKPYLTEDEMYAKFNSMYEPFGFNKRDISEIVIGSVVPSLTPVVVNSLQRIHGFAPKVVDRTTPSSVTHTSKQMGTDLYANAIAAQELYTGKKIVIDFGTALTFMVVDEDGMSLGVVIAPGINTALKSLVGETAQLPEIELKAPESVLGFDTVSCMQSGVVYGFLSLVEGMIDRINSAIESDSFVIATGGLSTIFAPLTNKIHVQDTLHTLKGLALLGK